MHKSRAGGGWVLENWRFEVYPLHLFSRGKVFSIMTMMNFRIDSTSSDAYLILKRSKKKPLSKVLHSSTEYTAFARRLSNLPYDTLRYTQSTSYAEYLIAIGSGAESSQNRRYGILATLHSVHDRVSQSAARSGGLRNIGPRVVGAGGLSPTRGSGSGGE